MNSAIDYRQQFLRADRNRKGRINERDFREFLGPVRRTREQNRASQFTKEDQAAFDATPVIETVTYEIGYDVALCGFVKDPIRFERYSRGSAGPSSHSYRIGPDVGIGAPNIAQKITQYDPAGAMFYFADFNHDMQLDETEFNYLMRSI